MIRVAFGKVLIAFVALLATSVDAADKQKVIYPDGTVVYEEVSVEAPASAVVATAVLAADNPSKCCTLCEDGDPDCPGCKKGLNEPDITKSGGPGCHEKDCEDITPKVEGDLELLKIKEDFYKKCVDFEAPVPIPVLVCRTVETYEFKTMHVKADDCCEYKVCVPCKRCEECKKTCELRKKKAKLRICLRRTGGIDVYVLNVPGMPTEWLLVVDETFDNVKAAIGEFTI